jgi:ectoine hydroxylase-related dioxygenase (phytanoyl-CoA dioxygenase family)
MSAVIAFCLPDGTRYAFSRGPDDTTEDTVVELDAQAWQELRDERRSAFGLLYAGMLSFVEGGFEDLAAWEPELRRQWHGRPAYDDAAVAAMAGVDLGRSYTLDDADDEMRDFLQTTGFLHVRNVFAADEIAVMRDEVERLKAIASPDDGQSWFAKNRDGKQVCCRLIYLAQRSADLAKVADDGRLRRLAALSGEQLRPTIDRLDGVSVVIKNPDVVEGLSDLPWHQDCGLGGHPVLCPALNIGIQLDVASADNGQLRFLAGSHRHAIPVDCFSRPDLPIVAIDTRPGDVTVHFGHVSHEAPPPRDPAAGRRALYVGFATDRLFETVPAGSGYNDVLLQTPGQPAPAALT